MVLCLCPFVPDDDELDDDELDDDEELLARENVGTVRLSLTMTGPTMDSTDGSPLSDIVVFRVARLVRFCTPTVWASKREENVVSNWTWSLTCWCVCSILLPVEGAPPLGSATSFLDTIITSMAVVAIVRTAALNFCSIGPPLTNMLFKVFIRTVMATTPMGVTVDELDDDDELEELEELEELDELDDELGSG